MEKFIKKLEKVTLLVMNLVTFILVLLFALFLVVGIPILIILTCKGII